VGERECKRERERERGKESYPEGSTGMNEEHPFLREEFPDSPGEF